jgi:WhiB family redox-sensing transcriptional regulator
MNDFPMFDMTDASCATEDPELFFPDGSNGRSAKIAQAKEICATCPIAVQCLQYAVLNDEDGIWGGTTPSERKLLKKSRTFNVGKVQ